jgi:hypothetical protein
MALKSQIRFLFPILWCSHIDDHIQQEELTKFGYILERKEEKSKNHAILFQLFKDND